MSNFGFVYVLTNSYMPDIYKVGCTERSPHARAEELSRPTGVPHPFKVLCYIECPEFQAVEKRLHHFLSKFRINNNREFFEGGLKWAIGFMYWLDDRLAFCEPLPAEGDPGMFCELEELVEFNEYCQLPNPWAKPAAPASAADIAADAIETAKTGVNQIGFDDQL